jgi:hypothetical protein
MAKRLVAVVATLFIAGFVPALHAEASTVPTCGASVSGTVSFTGDLDCTRASGLILAGNTTIKLNNFTFTGDSGVAIDNSGGHLLRLLGPGTIDGFGWGVESDGGISHVAGVTFTNMSSPPVAVIVINANKAHVDGNVFTNDNTSGSGNLIAISGNEAKVRRNSADNTNSPGDDAIDVFGNKALVKGNTVSTGSATSGDGIAVIGSNEQIIGNAILKSAGDGIHVDGTNVQIKSNDTEHNVNGVYSEPNSKRLTLGGNTISNNTNDGVLIDSGAKRVFIHGNTIENNTNFGIEAITVPPTPRTKNDTYSNNTAGDCSFTPCR